MDFGSDPTPPGDVALACDATALDSETRRAHFTWLSEDLPRLVAELQDLPDGYGLRLPGASFPAVATFVERERRCCPFLRFAVELEPGGTVLCLKLTGPAGVREFLEAELRLNQIAAGLAGKATPSGRGE